MVFLIIFLLANTILFFANKPLGEKFTNFYNEHTKDWEESTCWKWERVNRKDIVGIVRLIGAMNCFGAMLLIVISFFYY